MKVKDYKTCWNWISDWCCITLQHLYTNFLVEGTCCKFLTRGNCYTTLSITWATYQRRGKKRMKN